jgi:chemotaxis family two-component system sensor kinase Cph1
VDQALSQLQVAVAESNALVECASLPLIEADARQLVQLFQNLIANALKFRGPNRPDVHIAALEDEKEAIFSIRDNGIGIEPGYHDRLFRVFQRLHTRREYPGSGIGLAICKRIVERHRGRIWVESTAGAGATFFFSIPR